MFTWLVEVRRCVSQKPRCSYSVRVEHARKLQTCVFINDKVIPTSAFVPGPCFFRLQFHVRRRACAPTLTTGAYYYCRFGHSRRFPFHPDRAEERERETQRERKRTTSCGSPCGRTNNHAREQLHCMLIDFTATSSPSTKIACQRTAASSTRCRLSPFSRNPSIRGFRNACCASYNIRASPPCRPLRTKFAPATTANQRSNRWPNSSLGGLRSSTRDCRRTSIADGYRCRKRPWSALTIYTSLRRRSSLTLSSQLDRVHGQGTKGSFTHAHRASYSCLALSGVSNVTIHRTSWFPVAGAQSTNAKTRMRHSSRMAVARSCSTGSRP